MNRIFRSQRGIALILTLVMVTLLTGWALSLNLRVRNTLFETIEMKKRISLYDRAESGIDIAKIILIKDREAGESDTLHEFWADEAKIAEYIKALGFKDKELQIKIIDQLSKIQINALVLFPNNKNGLQVKLWERFLDGLKTEFPELIKNPYDIINPILDWLDYGDDDAITGLTGAETDYYESEGQRYLPRNGPMKSVDEISLTKGVSEKLWNKVSISGIAHEYLTIDGNIQRSGKTFNYMGKININTAPQAVIAALITDNAFLHMAEEIVAYRDEQSDGKFVHDLEGAWYKECDGCKEVPLSEKLITTSSDIFRIISIAKDGEEQIKIDCVIEREKNKDGKWSCKNISWITE